MSSGFAALLLAFIDLPDFLTPFKRIATSVETIAGQETAAATSSISSESRPAEGRRSLISSLKDRRGPPMLELMLCSMVTLLPDYLFRRYVQGRRIGHEITIFSVWYELALGHHACLILTVLLITVVLVQPSGVGTTSPRCSGPSRYFPRSAAGYRRFTSAITSRVKKGDPLFKMDSTRQEAALETARARIAEVDASAATAKADILTSEGKFQEAKGALEQAQDELRTKTQLQQRNADIVAAREIEKLQTLVATRQGAVDAAAAAKQSAQTRISSVITGAEGERGGRACRS